MVAACLQCSFGCPGNAQLVADLVVQPSIAGKTPVPARFHWSGKAMTLVIEVFSGPSTETVLFEQIAVGQRLRTGRFKVALPPRLAVDKNGRKQQTIRRELV